LGEHPAERDKVIPEMLKLTLNLFESSSYILFFLVNYLTLGAVHVRAQFPRHTMVENLSAHAGNGESINKEE
jgi:hypothetical protein